MKSLFVFAAATAAVLTSAAFATPGPGSRTPLTDDQAMTCKIPDVRVGASLGRPAWERTAVCLDHRPAKD
jgi:hypothetical protein